MLLTRESLRERDDTVYETVPVPEWGENATLVVRSLTTTEREEFEASVPTKKGARGKRVVDPKGLRTRLIVLATCRSQGDKSPFFAPGDEAWVQGKNGAAIERLFDTIARLTGIVESEVEAGPGSGEPAGA